MAIRSFGARVHRSCAGVFSQAFYLPRSVRPLVPPLPHLLGDDNHVLASASGPTLQFPLSPSESLPLLGQPERKPSGARGNHPFPRPTSICFHSLADSGFRRPLHLYIGAALPVSSLTTALLPLPSVPACFAYQLRMSSWARYELLSPDVY